MRKIVKRQFNSKQINSKTYLKVNSFVNLYGTFVRELFFEQINGSLCRFLGRDLR